MNYKLIKSQRKTLAIQIKNCEVIVRAPLYTPQYKIDEFFFSHLKWIEKHMPKQENDIVPITREELKILAQKALAYIPERVAYYASMLGVDYSKITIRNQHTRWGSCSSKGNLNFNCLLMLAPPEVLDSVIVHEICHRKEMNHSKRFYSLVNSIYPEYSKWHGWLKINGSVLMRRMEKGETL